MKFKKPSAKTVAIIFITLFIIENLLIFGSYYIVSKEIEKENQCLYDVCGENPYAEYDSDVCYCYDYDLLEQLYVIKTEYMN